ncbi:MAG: adenylyltransferase/cytidyltransferase family protein [Candidatus Bathyarchaeota archaeon]|nr:adenylyltransferase/cytidyltransferase family protein [Candidatus Bathyarchaeota archaeon]
MSAGYAFVVADILHVGILRYLEISKSLCDFLIVGVLTDEAAASYKRKPVIPFDERVDMIRALRCVDMVVRQNVRDPGDTIKELVDNGWNINLLTHGDDWPEIPGSDYIKSVGGRVIRTPYYLRQSTTEILEKIRGEP